MDVYIFFLHTKGCTQTQQIRAGLLNAWSSAQPAFKRETKQHCVTKKKKSTYDSHSTLK